MKFKAEQNALIAQRLGETVRIEAWGADSLRVRATMYPAFTGNEWALTEKPDVSEPRIAIGETAEIVNGRMKAAINEAGVMRNGTSLLLLAALALAGAACLTALGAGSATAAALEPTDSGAPSAIVMDAFTAGVSDNGVCLEDSPTHRCTPAQPSAPRRRLQGAYAYGGFCSAILGVFYSKASAVSMQSAAGPMYRCFFQAPAALSFHGRGAWQSG